MHAVCVTQTSQLTPGVPQQYPGGGLVVGGGNSFTGLKKKSAAFEDWLCECEVGCMMKLRDGILKNCNVSQ